MLHWIPSHIEKELLLGAAIEGNKEADRLAEIAREQSKENHDLKQTERQREQILKAIGHTLLAIKNRLPSSDPESSNGPSHTDDFDATDASPETTSDSGDTTSVSEEEKENT